MKFSFVVNGSVSEVEVMPMKRLLDVLREDLCLTGTKEGCGEGECGACSVIVDSKVVNSCLIPVCQVEGSSILTVEGLARDGKPDLLQRAFLEFGAAQCGICTPGMLMAARSFLDSASEPTRDNVRIAIAGNLCRCTGYIKIVDAIQQAAGMEGTSHE
jgi:Aerobic-type carbon monoxide dehydrogenase, small subunit CoxS/CutS homologs